MDQTEGIVKEFIPKIFLLSLGCSRRCGLGRFTAKFSHCARKFEYVPQEHFREKAKSLRVPFRKLFWIMQSGISFNSYMIGPRSNVRRNSMIFVQPNKPVKESDIRRNAVHSLRSYIERGPIHSHRRIPFLPAECVLSFEKPSFYRPRRVGWRRRRISRGPYRSDTPRRLNITGMLHWLAMKSASMENAKANGRTTCTAYGAAIPLVLWPIQNTSIPLQRKRRVLRRTMWAISNKYSQ